MKQKAATVQIAEATQQQIKTQGWQSLWLWVWTAVHKKRQQRDGKKEKHSSAKKMKPELRESEEMCFYTAMHKKRQQLEVFVEEMKGNGQQQM